VIYVTEPWGGAAAELLRWDAIRLSFSISYTLLVDIRICIHNRGLPWGGS